METSPGYHYILEEGIQKGRQEGLCRAIRTIVACRLGTFPADLDEQLATLSGPELDALLYRLSASADGDAIRAILAELG